MTHDINHRARKILYAIVSEYLHTGDAVGSRTVTRRHGIDLSPATVRNVMADLEEMGLLEQPHTSAGRVPTESGLRFFIDSLLKVRSLSPKEKEEIRERYGTALDFDELLQRTSRVLSDITHYAGLVLVPNPGRQKLRQIEFLPLSSGRFLCILVTSEGRIENKLVQVDVPIDVGQLERMHNYLNQLLEGLTLDEVRDRVLRELGEEKNRYDAMVAQALRLSRAALERTEASASVIVSGAPNLLDPARAAEPETLVRMRALLQALEEKELLVGLLDRTMASDRIQVFLGAETAFDALGDTAMVVAPYGPGERPVGAIAVIGPTRMNYGKVMSVVDFTAEFGYIPAAMSKSPKTNSPPEDAASDSGPEGEAASASEADSAAGSAVPPGAVDDQDGDIAIEVEPPEPTPEERIAELEAKAREGHDRYIRSVAELDNVRKRARKDMEEARLDAQSRVLREMLPVIDNLERAVAHASQSGDGASGLLEGIQLVLRQFAQALERCNVHPVAAKGLPFDPNQHEAVSQVVTPDAPAGSVVDVMQTGYRIGERLLRPALVVVAKAPPEPPAGPNGRDPTAES